MDLSIVIASYKSPESLRECLESLSAQPEAKEIVVADCSPEDPSLVLGPLFPGVRFLHFSETRTIPQLRWAAYEETSGDVLAATEGRCIPAGDWCARILEAHRTYPEAPGIGGPIAPLFRNAFDLGLFFCEYGWYCPPAIEGPTREASGANVSYKRDDLEASRDLIDAGAWETPLHERWRLQGRSLRMCPAEVFFRNSMRAGAAFRQRFHYGRGFAANRVASATPTKRLAYAAFGLLLPFVLTLRLGRVAHERKRLAWFLRALLWVLLLSAIWSAGETMGYLFGHPRKALVF